MKVLVLGRGVANDGVVLLFDKHNIEYDYLNISEVKSYDYLYVVKAPGISMNEMIIQNFLNLSIKVVTDIWVALRYCNKKFIGVTGTNGKTTTVSMIYNILKSKYKVCVCGNIGYSVCRALVEEDVDIFVVELSSFQLECVEVDFDISILLNLSPHHLDHHDSFDDYKMSKYNIFKYQDTRNYFICNNKICDINRTNILYFSLDSLDCCCYIKENDVYFNNEYIISLDEKREYMIENILASITCVKLFVKITNEDIKQGIESFKEVEYRCNKVCDYIYNDAKSTNPYSTIASIKVFDNVFLICGGYDRGENLDCLSMYLDKIKKVFAYGASKKKIYDYFLKNNKCCYIYNTVEEAFIAACNNRCDEIILYSPMFASFDQFKNFEQRGKIFDELCKKYLEK